MRLQLNELKESLEKIFVLCTNIYKQYMQSEYENPSFPTINFEYLDNLLSQTEKSATAATTNMQEIKENYISVTDELYNDEIYCAISNNQMYKVRYSIDTKPYLLVGDNGGMLILEPYSNLGTRFNNTLCVAFKKSGPDRTYANVTLEADGVVYYWPYSSSITIGPGTTDYIGVFGDYYARNSEGLLDSVTYGMVSKNTKAGFIYPMLQDLLQDS